jgi:small redox-active disulfide protein 2
MNFGICISFEFWALKFDIVFQELCMLTIRILGTGCPNCDQLHKEVINALAELNIAADVRHERNVSEFYKYGVAVTPALVINGEVKAVGGVPTRNEIKGWLQSMR